MIFSGITIWHTLSISGGAILTLFILHFLYRNYTKVRVPTLIFWQAVAQNTIYNRLWRKFRQLLTFLFLAIILILLIFAMARPFLISPDRIPMRYALILDCRASMAIVDEGSSSSRLERAKDLCRKFLKDSSEFDKTMLITAGQTADVIKGFGDNKAQGLHLLENIEPAGFLDGDAVSQAIEITQSSINDISQTHIIVFTDHAAELENLPFQIKQNLTVVNAAAKPVANAAILQSKIMPADNNMLQVSITIGYWGQNKIQGELELYADQNIPQKQSIELSPDTVEQYSFAVSRQPIGKLSAKLVCDDTLKNDNSVVIHPEIDHKIYIDANAPAALKFYIEADPFCHIAQDINSADISISIVGGDEQIASAAKVIPTPQLYPDENKINTISSDLYVIGGSRLSNPPKNAVPVLTTEDGIFLACLHNKEIIMADCLFSEQSTFWKQTQFPELMRKIIETALTNDMPATKISPEAAQAAYANLWNVDTQANTRLPEELQQKPLPLYKYLIIAALICLGFEGYAFYKGVIV